ncbi:DEAD/DEAH box helicase [Streptomyces cacaoi]|uniref:Helicase n=2 Tax=Streptomyces cacaoi TaxID=1898 RepID=A0A4Y3R2F4_STRCI|nr:DEAD/DEAH box helicase [Streptomyces cacaoi]GEB51712.1 hypothetical protein SCA03_42630 [Streptomyces cacaoi]
MGPGGGAGFAECAAVFLPGELPRQGRIAFWRPGGGPLPQDGPGREETLTVVRPHGSGVRQRTVPALTLSVGEALPLLTRARTNEAAHPAAACWGAAALHGLRLVARGRLVPALGEGDTDIWRAGPLDEQDVEHLRAVAAAMPPEGHAVPQTGPDGAGHEPLRLPEPESLVRDFLDAVADVLPRTPAAPGVAGPAFASAGPPLRLPERYPRIREWAAEAAAGTPAGIRVSLRLDLSPDVVFDRGPGGAGVPGERPGGAEDPGEGAGGPDGEERYVAAAVVQAHSVEDATLVADAGLLWAGEAEYLGPRARVDTVLALRRAARVWPPLSRLLERPEPDVLPLTEAELNELLGPAARELAAADVALHWPRTLARSLSATAVVGPRQQTPGSAADGFGFFKQQHLTEFRWQLALDGDPLTEDEMDELAEAHRPLVRLRDQWVVVDPELVRKARKRHLGLLSPGDALAAALGGAVEVDGEDVEAVPVGALAALRDRVRGAAARGGVADDAPGAGSHAAAAPGASPAGLRARLRGYQLQGLDWLDEMTSLGLGGCLADDMGLGKTVTLIALHLRRAERAAAAGGTRDAPGPRPTAPTLIVCPASLLGNWQRELARFAPGVPVRRFHGPGRSLAGLPGRGAGQDGPGSGGGPEVAGPAGELRGPLGAGNSGGPRPPGPEEQAGRPGQPGYARQDEQDEQDGQDGQDEQDGQDAQGRQAGRAGQVEQPGRCGGVGVSGQVVEVEASGSAGASGPVVTVGTAGSVRAPQGSEGVEVSGGAGACGQPVGVEVSRSARVPASGGVSGREVIAEAAGGVGRSGEGGDGGVVLTTYGTLRSSAAELAEVEWGLVVADEAQHVKNSRSATARALRTVPAEARVALTGTPLENNLSELWALLDWTTPGLLGPLKTFRARHARAVEGGEDPEATERLARLVRPFLLRRRKSDPGIVPELPPKTETEHPVALSREQASLYEAVVRETLAQIEQAAGIERRGLVMKLLTSLKQICNHPAQYLREGPEAGAARAGRSGKLAVLDELLGAILAEGSSVLVFTQYVAITRMLSAHLAARGVDCRLLHGGTPVARREEMVEEFQAGSVPVFLLSLKAAGTGLNLTRAAHVVHYDRWWNPAVEEQATDRAYRIGQIHPVQVHRLLTEGTVEDRIAGLLAAKRELADAVLGGGEAALTELTDAELADLVALRRQP